MKTGTETAFLRQKGHSIVRNLILRERTFKYSYAKIRHSILHALVSEPLSCRNLLYRLRLIYDLSERALVSRVAALGKRIVKFTLLLSMGMCSTSRV
jgi:hypothetical protein